MKGLIKGLSQKGEDKRFLDVGCGTGTCLKLGKSYFKQAVGVDVSLNMLKIAKDRGLDVIQADALFLPFKSNIFNTATSISVLHHIYNLPPILKEISKVLANSGFFYSDWDPNKIFKKKINRWFPGWVRNLLLPILLATAKSKSNYKHFKITDRESFKLAEYYHFL